MSASIAAARRRALTSRMTDSQLDFVLVYGNAWQSDYLRYVTDFGILEGEALALISRDGEVTLFVDSALEAERARGETAEVQTVYSSGMLNEVTDRLDSLARYRIASAPKRLMPQHVAAHASDLKICDATAMLDRLLMVKLDCEIEAIRSAAHLADEGYAVFRNAAREGRKDYELVAEAEAFFRTRGVDDNFMIIGVGGTEVRGMSPPMGKVLKPGDLVTTELTPCIDGYYIQICRTLVLGQPTAAQHNAFAVFRDALEAGIAAVKPGATAADVALAENEIFRAHKLGDYVTEAYTRVRGHGLGLFVDTKPHILENVTTVIEPGMTMIVHPNTYHPDVGYVVLGDAVIAGPAGAEVLTRTARELFVNS
jgi:Xaa-Pro aminopeptidase